MSESGESARPDAEKRRLADSIREVKNASADRDDVVVELREAARQRLEILADELAPIFEEVPSDEPYFDFAISSGLQPRLWIDAVAHVSMGRDRRTYRFVRNTRLGPVVLAESANMKPVADQVMRYIAERIVERERLLEGGVETAIRQSAGTMPAASTPEIETESKAGGKAVTNILLVLLGMVIAVAVLAVVYRERLPELGLGF
jgi:hypothetical protein